VLESLALKYRYALNTIERLLLREIEVIHIVGGGSRNRLLNQFTADATGKRIIAGPVEATAAGNALIQAIAQRRLGGLADLREWSPHRSRWRRSNPALRRPGRSD